MWVGVSSLPLQVTVQTPRKLGRVSSYVSGSKGQLISLGLNGTTIGMDSAADLGSALAGVVSDVAVAECASTSRTIVHNVSLGLS